MSVALEWHDEAILFGIRVRAYFFDQVAVDARDDFVARNLPIFKIACPELVVTEADRKNFIVGELIGQPDAVLRHGDGLISMEFKSNSSHKHDPARWQYQLGNKLKAMLQCIGGAMVVSAALHKPTAAILRFHNVLYHLDPRQELIDLLAHSISGARAYMGESRRVNITQLAEYCDAKVRRDFGVMNAEQQAAAAAGIRRHEVQLRR
jgi:hypothetical protein